MKILSIQGHFGNLSGRKIEFSEGFCRSVLPNGWGKTTLFALVRVMLYGLDIEQRDTASRLSDRTRYAPRDGRPMSGRMLVGYQGRVIVLERATDESGPMQAFRAYDEQTGEPCVELETGTCGRVLTGLSEDAFLSSVMIDGSAMQRPSEELREHIRDLTQTGDVKGQSARALRTLRAWQDKLAGTEEQPGVLPRLRQALREMDETDRRSAERSHELTRLTQEITRLETEMTAAQADYEREYRAYAGSLASEEERLTALIEESGRMIAHLESCLPPDDVLRAATDAMYGYEGAVQLEKEKRERIPRQGDRYEEALKRLEQERSTDEAARNEAAKPHIRWWALVMALLFAVASAATVIFDVNWGKITPVIHYLLSGLAFLAIVIAFAGSVRRCPLPKRDFAAERDTLERMRLREQDAQQTAAVVLQEAYDAFMEAVHQIDPQIQTVEQAMLRVRDAQEDEQALRREHGARQELLERRKNLELPKECSGGRVAQAREALAALQKQLDECREAAARLRGQADVRTEDGQLSRASLTQARDDAERQLHAVELALQVAREEQDKLTARFSPEITRLTCEYLREMTAGEIQSVQLDGALEARCAGADGTLLDALQLSTGTRDQLYLALRLAVCNVLSREKEAPPILLDDPFLTFDDDRSARALVLLRRLARDRQVILLTCRGMLPVRPSAGAHKPS